MTLPKRFNLSYSRIGRVLITLIPNSRRIVIITPYSFKEPILYSVLYGVSTNFGQIDLLGNLLSMGEWPRVILLKGYFTQYLISHTLCIHLVVLQLKFTVYRGFAPLISRVTGGRVNSYTNTPKIGGSKRTWTSSFSFGDWWFSH